MNILLTNDDGIDHPGLQTLLLTLSKNTMFLLWLPIETEVGSGAPSLF